MVSSSKAPRRTRPELSEFLRSRRERLTPADVGLPAGSRRRTPGLRREEVAALAGVGLAWYTWLEQGREISVSTGFLDNLSRVLKLDAAERRHLFLLAQQRLPPEPATTWCVVPPLVHRLMGDLPKRPAYILNLRWDVLAWNAAADLLFRFSIHPAHRRNLLWLLFADNDLRKLFDPWEEQAQQILSSFRRDFARSLQDPDIDMLIKSLEKTSPEFKKWWQEQDIHGPCQGIRHLNVKNIGRVTFEHTTLTIDEDRHLRLVYYAAKEAEAASQAFERLIQQRSESVGADIPARELTLVRTAV
jgi:transcriptional regulator with XRE-family HTH domain